VISTRRIPGLVLTGLFASSLHLLVLGSVHDHDLSTSVQVSAPHVCFLCQVSPNVDVAPVLAASCPCLSIVEAPRLPSFEVPPEPVLLIGTARSPPA
jgi:hypothetical protein